MIDASRTNTPDWLAALRDPIKGDLKLSSFIRAPEHIPDVLKAFGEQLPPDRRRIVVALDHMVKNLRLALEYEPTLTVTDREERLNRIVRSGKSILQNMHSELRFAIFWANLLEVPVTDRDWKVPIADRDTFAEALYSHDATFDVSLMLIISGAEKLLNNPEIYRAVLWQPPGEERHKALVRALLWEPLLNLLDDFKIESYDQHQPLIDTIRSLHLACGVDPPKEGAVRVAVHERKKAALSQQGKSPPT
ncbi:hypothetical protein ACRQ5Q_43080 (plasmid) [Bradyrhizobium sp. PMVTL-01]|uniref:hypothetical protein n=1 Tax=Bradyrhizobium sp. PMVTL-01 TaxID=3434999 RepID=UPI003F700B69